MQNVVLSLGWSLKLEIPPTRRLDQVSAQIASSNAGSTSSQSLTPILERAAVRHSCSFVTMILRKVMIYLPPGFAAATSDVDPPAHPGLNNLLGLINEAHIQQQLRCTANR